MANDEVNAVKMEAMSQAIIASIESSGDAENMAVVMGALGAVVGCIAMATGRTEFAIQAMTDIARSVDQFTAATRAVS